MITKLQDLRNASREEVFGCYEEVQRDGIKSAEFQSHYGTDYVYSMLSNELSSRGYVNGWYDPTASATVKEIPVEFSKETARMNLAMTKSCKARYEKFLGEMGSQYIYTTAAINHFLDDVAAGNIKISIALPKEGV